MQRNFEPMRQQVETWRKTELSTVTAKMIIYEAFIESELEVPGTWRGECTTCTLNRNIPSSNPERSGVSNAFTSAFKDLAPIPQFRDTAKLGSFLDTCFKRSF
jgi:hypothetical protein